MDFLIACVDGINGPRSQMRFNGYFLINGFSLSPPLGTLNHGFVNYESTTPMDGSQVPTLLRVKGTFAGISTFDSLVLFFDTLTPFYSNPATGEIYCANTGSNSPCAFYPGIAITTGNEKYNYNLLSRI